MHGINMIIRIVENICTKVTITANMTKIVVLEHFLKVDFTIFATQLCELLKTPSMD